SPARTESLRVAPPGVAVTPTGASHRASAASTTTTPSHDSRATPTARSSTVAPPRCANCLVPPKRSPDPAATTIAHVFTPSVWPSGRCRSGSGVFESCEEQPARRSRHDRRHLQHHFRAADQLATTVHDHHRTVVEMTDTLADFLALAGERDAHEI